MPAAFLAELDQRRVGRAVSDLLLGLFFLCFYLPRWSTLRSRSRWRIVRRQLGVWMSLMHKISFFGLEHCSEWANGADAS